MKEKGNPKTEKGEGNKLSLPLFLLAPLSRAPYRSETFQIPRWLPMLEPGMGREPTKLTKL